GPRTRTRDHRAVDRLAAIACVRADGLPRIANAPIDETRAGRPRIHSEAREARLRYVDRNAHPAAPAGLIGRTRIAAGLAGEPDEKLADLVRDELRTHPLARDLDSRAPRDHLDADDARGVVVEWNDRQRDRHRKLRERIPAGVALHVERVPRDERD